MATPDCVATGWGASFVLPAPLRLASLAGVVTATTSPGAPVSPPHSRAAGLPFAYLLPLPVKPPAGFGTPVRPRRLLVNDFEIWMAGIAAVGSRTTSGLRKSGWR